METTVNGFTAESGEDAEVKEYLFFSARSAFSAVQVFLRQKMSFADAIGLRRGDVLALVGAGGKTAVSMFVGMELLAHRWPVAVCSTTMNLLPGPDPRITPLFLREQSDVGHRIRAALDSLSLPWIGAAPSDERDPDPGARGDVAYPVPLSEAKIHGISPEEADALQESMPDLTLIVEADGARHRWLKAPAGYEPQVPSLTTVLSPMAHLGIVGQPLAEAHVHRPERVAALLGKSLGAVISPEDIAAILTHAEGGLKGWRPGMRIVPILTLPEPRLTDDTAHMLFANPQVSHVAVAWLGENPWAKAVRRT